MSNRFNQFHLFLRGTKSLFQYVIISLVGFGSLSLIAQEESLIINPPFKQVDSRQTTTTTVAISTEGSLNERFELAGILGLSGKLKFSVHDKTTKKPFWLEIGESFEGIKVESYDSDKIGLVVSQMGKQEMLVLRESKNGGSQNRRVPAYRSMATPPMPTKNYPKPPPALPKPNKLIEQLRRQNN